MRFAIAAMARYSGAGTVVAWELWNEPNSVFWGSLAGNATQYYRLAKALRTAITAHGNLSSTVNLVGPALTNFGTVGPGGASGWDFLAELKGTAVSGSISTVLTGLSWICVGIHSRGALRSPVCA